MNSAVVDTGARGNPSPEGMIAVDDLVALGAFQAEMDALLRALDEWHAAAIARKNRERARAKRRYKQAHRVRRSKGRR